MPGRSILSLVPGTPRGFDFINGSALPGRRLTLGGPFFRNRGRFGFLGGGMKISANQWSERETGGDVRGKSRGSSPSTLGAAIVIIAETIITEVGVVAGRIETFVYAFGAPTGLF